MKDPYIARATRLGTCTLAGEAIIVTPSDSRVYNLNPVATFIWEAADGQSRVSEIVQRRICREFEVDPATAMADAMRFIEDFCGKGLLRESETPFEADSVGQPFLGAPGE